MRFIGKLLVVPLFAVLSGCMGQLPIVGLDKEGKAIETLIKKRVYVSRLTDSVVDLQDSVIPALDSRDARRMASLREARLGLHLKGEAGIGDYFKLGGNIGFRLVFAN